MLQHVPAFLDWSSGRIVHFEASRSDRLERGHEVIDPAFAEHVGLGPQKCRHLSCAWYGHCPSPSLIVDYLLRRSPCRRRTDIGQKLNAGRMVRDGAAIELQRQRAPASILPRTDAEISEEGSVVTEWASRGRSRR